MIKAPFKRKTTPNPTPKDTPKSGRASSTARSLSPGSSSVNSMDLNECDSNVYAEIDINTAVLSTNPNNTIAIVDSADTDTNHEIESSVFDSMPSLNMLEANATDTRSEVNSSKINLFEIEDIIGVTLDLHMKTDDDVDHDDDDDDDHVGVDDDNNDRVEIRMKPNIEIIEIDTAQSASSLDAGDDGTYKVLKKSSHPEDGTYKVLKTNTLPYMNQEIADNFKMEVSQNLYDIDVSDNENRSKGAIKKTDLSTYKMSLPEFLRRNVHHQSEPKKHSPSIGFNAKSANRLINSLKDRLKKSNNAEVFEPIGESSADSIPHIGSTPNNNNSKSTRTDHVNISADKFNDIHLKNRLKSKLMFGFKFAASKKSKICQRCLRHHRNADSSKNVTNRAKEIGDVNMGDIAYCRCSVDSVDDGSRIKEHTYSDLIGVSIQKKALLSHSLFVLLC